MPDVSVLTPSYGYGRFIRDALISVSRQGGISLEHIVQDAGSPDDTIEILREFDDRIRWRSEPDRGQSDALNRAFGLSSGRWVGWLNADEFYLPGGLKTLVSEGERTGADVVYADAVWVDEDGRLIRLLPEHRFSRYLLKNYGCYIGSCATIFRRDALGTEPWDVDVHSVLDWELYLRLEGEGARFHYVKHPIAAYRIHAGQISAQPPEQFLEDRKKLRTRYRMPPWDRRHAAYLHSAYKLASGAYRRQFIADRMRGADLRWFQDDVGLAPVERLVRRCYGRDI
jgi:glycosyltransferase involved in cell wall biosynthesis